MKYLFEQWHKSKLKTLLYIFWLLTVFTSFLGDALFSIAVPFVGSLFPFRVLLPLTALLFIVWSLKEKRNFWKESSLAEKICFAMIVLLLLHSAISLFFSIDFGYSFRRVFNLCFDLCLFFLMLKLCTDKTLFQLTMKTVTAGFIMLSLLGIWECVFGPVFHDPHHPQEVSIFGWSIISPEVNYNNTNDFATAIVFSFAMVAVWLLLRKTIRRKDWIFLFISLLVVFFFIESASARLLSVAFWIILVAMIVYTIVIKHKRAVAVFALLTVLMVTFSFTKTFDLRDVILNGFSSEQTNVEKQPKPQISIKDQFLEMDPDTNEIQLNAQHSAGVRSRLLIHAVDCFLDSKGMGVGVGNTEKTAQSLAIAKDGTVWAIHCFLARMIGDYGIWFLLPLCSLGVLFVLYVVKLMRRGFKTKNVYDKGIPFVLCGAILVFVLASTSPADAQDILPMWMFLAVFVKQIKLEHNQNGWLISGEKIL